MTRNPSYHHTAAIGLSLLIGLIAIVISGKAHGLHEIGWGADARVASVVSSDHSWSEPASKQPCLDPARGLHFALPGFRAASGIQLR